MMKKSEAIKKIKNMKARSAWLKGVNKYAIDVLESRCSLDELPEDRKNLHKELLNGASDWSEYSWGGMLINL